MLITSLSVEPLAAAISIRSRSRLDTVIRPMEKSGSLTRLRSSWNSASWVNAEAARSNSSSTTSTFSPRPRTCLKKTSTPSSRSYHWSAAMMTLATAVREGSRAASSTRRTIDRYRSMPEPWLPMFSRTGMMSSRGGSVSSARRTALVLPVLW